MRGEILQVVSSRGGIKAIKLMLEVMERVNPQSFNKDEYHEIISELVATDEIVELEYIEPHMPDRIKSMYFSKNTMFLNLKAGDIARNPDKTVVDGKSKGDT